MTIRARCLAISAIILCLGVTVHAEAPPFENWEPDIRAFEATDRADPPMPGGIVFIGSSSIRLWTTLARDFPGVRAINRGFGGSEIADATHFADRIVIPYRPRQIVVYAGDNDLMNGKSPTQVAEAFTTFVQSVRRDLPDVRVAFIAIKPSPARASLIDAAREANRLILGYAKRSEGIDYIDIFTPMLGDDGRPRPELFVDDQLHLNAAGYGLWRDVVAPYLLSSSESNQEP